MNSKKEPRLVVLVKLGASDEVSAVEEGEAVTVSCILRGIPVRQNQERIVLMAGSSPRAADGLDPVP